MRAFRHNFDYFHRILSEAPFQKGLSIISFISHRRDMLPKHMEDSTLDINSFVSTSVKVWNWKTKRMSDKGVKVTNKGREYIKDSGKTIYLDEFSNKRRCDVTPFEVEKEKWYFNMSYKFENGKLYEKYNSSSHESFGFKSYNGGVSGGYSTLDVGGYTFLNVCRGKVLKGEFTELTFDAVWKN